MIDVFGTRHVLAPGEARHLREQLYLAEPDTILIEARSPEPLRKRAAAYAIAPLTLATLYIFARAWDILALLPVLTRDRAVVERVAAELDADIEPIDVPATAHVRAHPLRYGTAQFGAVVGLSAVASAINAGPIGTLSAVVGGCGLLAIHYVQTADHKREREMSERIKAASGPAAAVVGSHHLPQL